MDSTILITAWYPKMTTCMEKLLSLSAILKPKKSDRQEEDSKSSCLSLKQLIQVHESLIYSIQDNIVFPNSSVKSDSDDVESIVKRHVKDPNEIQLCRDILNSHSQGQESKYDSQDVLLTVQYLLRISVSMSMSTISGGQEQESAVALLAGLKNITFPLLLISPHYDVLLRDAIMDASFVVSHITSVDATNISTSTSTSNGNGNGAGASASADEGEMHVLDQCLAFMHKSTARILNTPIPSSASNSDSESNSLTWINIIVTTCSKIMTRILSLETFHKKECKELVLTYMHKLIMDILDSICFYSKDVGLPVPLVVNGKTTVLMRPITALLLPALLEEHEQNEQTEEHGQVFHQRMDQLWQFICDLIDPDPKQISNGGKRKCRSWERAAPSVASALLCSLAGKIHSLPLSVPSHRLPGNTSENANETKCKLSSVPIIQHFTFWKFIQSSLHSGDGSDGAEIVNGSEARGMKGGGGFSSKMANPYQDDDLEDSAVDQMVRRRAIHILSCIIDAEHDNAKARQISPRTGTGTASSNSKDEQELMRVYNQRIAIWKKYILCFHSLEMETESHLVDQVWSTVVELCAACVTDANAAVGAGTGDLTQLSLPQITWDWVGALFARVLLSDSPTLRKLGLFRLFLGSAGIKAEEDTIENAKAGSKSRKNTRKGKGAGPKQKVQPAPISIVSPSFMLFCLVQSFDSLVSVGTGVNFEVNGKTASHDLAKMLSPFLTRYTRALFDDQERLQSFIEGVLSEAFIGGTRALTLVLILDSIVEAWNGQDSVKVQLSIDCIDKGVAAFKLLCDSGSVVFDFRQSLLLNLSKILSYSVLQDGKKPDPILILKTLALYPASEEINEVTEFDTNSAYSLNSWLKSFGEDWSVTVAAACATSFISGDLLPYGEGDANGLVGTSNLERQRGAAVAKLCALSGNLESNSPSALLWPAINKGLSYGAPLGLSSLALSKEMGHKLARAVILLENGCKQRVLGGIGHGDLVLDKDGIMMPPPPTIEMLLSRAVNFTLEQLRLVSVCNYDENNIVADSCGGRSTKSGEFANHFAILINQLMVLKKSYPSSIIMTQSLNALLRSSLDIVLEAQGSLNTGNGKCSVNDAVKMMKSMAIIYGVLTVGAELETDGNTVVEEGKKEMNTTIDTCIAVLALHFKKPDTSENSQIATWQVKAMTSLFEHSRWGALMHLTPMAYKNSSASASTLREFHNQVIDHAINSVNACPANALPALFEATVSSARQSFDMFTEEEKNASNAYAKSVGKIIEALLAIMKDTSRSPVRAFMLNVTCSLLFQPRLVSEEFNSLLRIKESGGKPNMKIDAPILQAFRKFIADAGISKPHISKYVMSYISVGWLGLKDDKENTGMAAIPYRLDIAQLLIHKEERLVKSAAHQEGLVKSYDEGDHAILPEGVSQTSTVRGFLTVFLSKLPDPDSMHKEVLTKLCHYLIMWLLDKVCLPNDRTGRTLLTTGSTEYVQKIRAWQALCMLHRFVTPDIASEVLEKVFEGMTQLLHGQIRYWIEVFTIQVSWKNPTAFVNLYKNEIKRCEITQQHISSLMIIGGNLFCGKYSSLFLKDITENNAVVLRDIIAGSVPWLSSTQGFCRAISQLLVHKLIPIAKGTIMENNDTFFLETISQFLDSNPEMIRLRKKQTGFFEEYNVDAACTPEGMFSVAVDEGDEADPPHLVEILKKCMMDVYEECESRLIPEWKQLEDEMAALTLQQAGATGVSVDATTDLDSNDGEALVNFQRKILPIDTLNLTLEDHKQASLRNAAGRTRQSLIVCASLIDKVTNLAGLTRTAEIFAAEKIIVPDIKVKKMDNFKSISVGAEDWVEIEECKEADLLPWLKARKNEGYSIIGIEQTSSSQCLSKVQFEEKSILLLGKEKEGIPVEFLQVVDKCVEIPQLGIIRSLNVHVSGAISIWEYTKQMMIKE